jgi:hypothetical protein
MASKPPPVRIAWSPPQVGKMLGICHEAVLALIRARRLGAVNIGTGKKKPRWRIFDTDIERFKESQRHEAAPPRAPRRKKIVNKTSWF